MSDQQQLPPPIWVDTAPGFRAMLAHLKGQPALAVDTHMKRIHQRLGLSDSDDPERIERDLMQLVPEPDWTHYTQRVIHHGRVCCSARQARCEACPLRADCPWPEAQSGAKPRRSAPRREKRRR